jgi:hypothetical protein
MRMKSGRLGIRLSDDCHRSVTVWAKGVVIGESCRSPHKRLAHIRVALPRLFETPPAEALRCLATPQAHSTPPLGSRRSLATPRVTPTPLSGAEPMCLLGICQTLRLSAVSPPSIPATRPGKHFCHGDRRAGGVYCQLGQDQEGKLPARGWRSSAGKDSGL